MIIGFGNDLLHIERIRKLYDRFGQRFLDRVYTDQEQDYAFLQKDPTRRLALRFAAKEACAKALGVGLRSGVNMKDIEVVAMSNRKPTLLLYGKAQKILLDLVPSHYQPRLDLALSDEPPYVLANVILSAY